MEAKDLMVINGGNGEVQRFWEVFVLFIPETYY